MNKRLILLKSGMKCESDGSFTICAILVSNEISNQKVEKETRKIFNQVKDENPDEYELDDFIERLILNGYEIAETPEEIIVRD